MISKDLLKGTLKTIVLKLLEENGRMYGYEITREVERLTESGTSAAKEKVREFIDFVTIMGRVLDTGPSLNMA